MHVMCLFREFSLQTCKIPWLELLYRHLPKAWYEPCLLGGKYRKEDFFLWCIGSFISADKGRYGKSRSRIHQIVSKNQGQTEGRIFMPACSLRA